MVKPDLVLCRDVDGGDCSMASALRALAADESVRVCIDGAWTWIHPEVTPSDMEDHP